MTGVECAGRVMPSRVPLQIGSYRLGDRLGAGGMGEVYRARDTKLDRDVAIKLLPSDLANDPERLVRFEREARILATLNHPNIGAIYGLEAHEGQPALVLELIPGDTLAECVARGPLPVATAIVYARQIAAAIDAAHEKGIVHRDLKPANIKIASDGTVKVLDFGLARAADYAGGKHVAETKAPTVAVTQAGMIMGTAAYMSPEQARGLAIDKRTDIWAFGCVVYEMLTGHLAFAGATTSDVVAAVLEREPDWAALPSATPPALRRILARCLHKDAGERLRDIGDARHDLEPSALSNADDRHGTRRSTAITYGGWGLAALLLVAVAVSTFGRRAPVTTTTAAAGGVVRSVMTMPAGYRLTAGETDYPLAMSRDGSRLAFVAEQNGASQLFVRDLAELEAKPIAGTAGARHPFFSPDGRWIAFFANGALQKVSIAGGAPLRLCAVTAPSMGGVWGDDRIVFAERGSDLMTIAVGGGTPQALAGSGPASWPSLLPDGRTLLFTALSGGNPSAIAAMPVTGGPKRIVARLTDSKFTAPDAAVLGPGGTILQVRYAATGHLVYGQSPGAVRAVPFDARTQTVTGSPLPILESLERARDGGGVYFAFSDNGRLVYAATGDRHQLVWVTRTGEVTPVSADLAAFRLPRLSPDGRRIAVAVSDDTRRSDLWLYDAERGTRRRLTTTGHNLDAVWAPDGKTLVTSRNGGFTRLSPDGGPDVDMGRPGERGGYPSSMSPDGRTLLSNVYTVEGQALHVLGPSGEQLLRANGTTNQAPRLSPDGRWVVWFGNETGRMEVYVARYPDMTDKVVVSTSGGERPIWSRDGRELFYRQGEAVMAVSVQLGQTLKLDRPRLLFSGPFDGESHESAFDVSPDGSRFLMIKADPASTLHQLVAVDNWFEELRARARAAP